MKQMIVSQLSKLDFASNEAMNTLATNLSYCGDNIKTILITSRYAYEGKSFISINLLRTLASLQKRVVLLDADLRRSRLLSHYGIRCSDEKPTGLAHYLAGMCELEDALYETNIPNAYILPIGREVNSSLQLLSSSRMPTLMETLKHEFDVVLVDTPPAGLIVDALEVAKYCDGALLVVNYKHGHTKDVNDVIAQIRRTGCPVLGTVLNNVNFKSFTNRMYYYKSERYASHYKGSYSAYKPVPHGK